MNNILICVFIGVLAGVIDVAPMIITKQDKTSNISAFIHYFALGFIIPYVSWDIASWLKGIIISLGTAIPFMVLVFPKDKKAIIPMLIFSIVLGAGIGIVGSIYIF